MSTLSTWVAVALTILFVKATLAQQPISGSADADSKPASPVWSNSTRVIEYHNRSHSSSAGYKMDLL